MTYFDPLVRRAAAQGINTLTLFVIADSYYPETSDQKTWEYEVGLDWPSDAFPHYRNAHCPNADPEQEYLPELIALCHTLGIRVYLRTINNKHRFLFPEHESWRAVRLVADGGQEPTSACCWDVAAFIEYYYRFLGELLQRYATGPNSIDGLILDQQKCFGPYVNAESRVNFQAQTGHEMDLSKPQEIRDYWSAQNAQRVRETVDFCRSISPSLELGVTLEALKLDHFNNGESGLKYDLFNLRTTGTDFIHHQAFDHSDEELREMWEKLTADGPLWVMLDPTAADAGWDKPYWGGSHGRRHRFARRWPRSSGCGVCSRCRIEWWVSASSRLVGCH